MNSTASSLQLSTLSGGAVPESQAWRALAASSTSCQWEACCRRVQKHKRTQDPRAGAFRIRGVYAWFASVSGTTARGGNSSDCPGSRISAKRGAICPNRKIFEARKCETAALGAGEKLVLGHPLAATIGDSARCMQNLEKVLFTGPKTSDTVTFICD